MRMGSPLPDCCERPKVLPAHALAIDNLALPTLAAPHGKADRPAGNEF
jgi:hypothetical protein